MSLIRICACLFMLCSLVTCQPEKFSWNSMKSVFKITKVTTGQLEERHLACSVDIINDLSSREPIFTQNGTLMVPQDGHLYWREGESSQIFCGEITGGAQNEIIGCKFLEIDHSVNKSI